MQRCGAAFQDAGGACVAEVGRERRGHRVGFPQCRCGVCGGRLMKVSVFGAASSEKVSGR